MGNVGSVGFYLELKAPGKKCSKLQDVIQRKIKETGACVTTVTNLEDAKSFLLNLRRKSFDTSCATR